MQKTAERIAHDVLVKCAQSDEELMDRMQFASDAAEVGLPTARGAVFGGLGGLGLGALLGRATGPALIGSGAGALLGGLGGFALGKHRASQVTPEELAWKINRAKEYGLLDE